MARYDEVFAELQAKLDAALTVIANHPEMQDELRDAMTATASKVAVDDPTDEARANALAAVLRQAEAVICAPGAVEGDGA